MAIIIARFNGHCRAECGRKIAKGDKIVHRGSFKSWHVDCYNETVAVNAYLKHTEAVVGPQRAAAAGGVDPGNAAEVALARRETSRDNREYQQGVRDYDNWKFNQSIYGEAEAERMEIERELKEGWDY